MRRFKAVFLDVDGTLYRSSKYEEHLLESTVAVLAELLQLGRAEAFRRLMSLKREVKTVSKSVELMGLSRSLFYGQLAERVMPEKYIDPAPEVVETLLSLRRRGLFVGLHTNSGRRLAAKVLGCLGVGSDCYDFIVTSDDAEPKPDPAGYMLLLSKSGAEAGEALYVGDRCDVELAPAKKIGMLTAGVNLSDCVYVDYILSSVVEVLGII
ncbi:MAG: HAD family hydrolase [Candidatus Caldarchaeum sp.]